MHNGPIRLFTVWGDTLARKFKPGYDFRSSDFRSQPDRRHQAHSGSAPPLCLAVAESPSPGPGGVPAQQQAKGVKPAPPPSDACPGPCNKPHHKAWRDYAKACTEYDPLDSDTSRPEPPVTSYVPGNPVWCAECAALVGKKLAQLDILAGILAATADGLREPGDLERVSGSTENPSPSPAADALDEMFGMLSTWETIYRELKGWSSGPPRGELASRETECVNWLQRHIRGILVSDIAADFGLEILKWHREGAGSAKAEVRTLRKPMRCPSCKYAMLFWTEGEKNVYCKSGICGRILTLGEYEGEVERLHALLQRGEDIAAGDAA